MYYWDYYYQSMSNEELLEDATNETLLDSYREKCKQVLLSRFESANETLEL